MANIIKHCKNCNKEFSTNIGQINAGYGVYCSKQCYRDYKNAHNKVTLTCQYCGEEYQKRIQYSKGSKYCSRRCKQLDWVKEYNCIDCGIKVSGKKAVRCLPCASKYKTKEEHERIHNITYVNFKCSYCGVDAKQKYNNYNKKGLQHFCNKKCEGKWRSENIRGEKTGSWKGGINNIPLYQGLRALAKYQECRKSVFERDNYTCSCGQKGGYLEAHHKITVSEMIKKYKINTVLEALHCIPLWNIDNGITMCWDCHQVAHGKKGRRAA